MPTQPDQLTVLKALGDETRFSMYQELAGSTAALTATVTTSFRRWEQHGPLRAILLMWGLRFLYWIGVPSHTLSRWYGLVR